MSQTKGSYRFKGHESFIIREGWLDKGMEALSANPRLFQKSYGAEELGVGPNMAKSIRYWLKAACLTEDKKEGVFLTEIGRIIYDKDPYLEDIFSLWVIHCNLVRNIGQATAWHLFFCRFNREEFTQEQLRQEMLELAEQLPGMQAVAERSVTDDCDAILRMYTKQKEKGRTPEEKNNSPFGILGLIRKQDSGYQKQQPRLDRLPKEVIWYLLLKFGDAVSIDTLLEDAEGPGHILNLRRNLLVELLEHLEEKEVIQMNRTAGLDMVYLLKKKRPEELLKTYYDSCRVS